MSEPRGGLMKRLLTRIVQSPPVVFVATVIGTIAGPAYLVSVETWALIKSWRKK